MRKQISVPKTQITCDGCDYIMSDPSRVPCITVTVPFEWDDGKETFDTLTFEFHALQGAGTSERRSTDRHDCFRYWAHNPDVMRRSLLERGLVESEIDEFMGIMLYKSSSFSPGIARPEPKSAA